MERQLLELVGTEDEPDGAGGETGEQTEEDACADCPEACTCPDAAEKRGAARRDVPASNAFVPGVAGLILAGEVVKDLIGWNEEAAEDRREDEAPAD